MKGEGSRGGLGGVGRCDGGGGVEGRCKSKVLNCSPRGLFVKFERE